VEILKEGRPAHHKFSASDAGSYGNNIAMMTIKPTTPMIVNSVPSRAAQVLRTCNFNVTSLRNDVLPSQRCLLQLHSPHNRNEKRNVEQLPQSTPQQMTERGATVIRCPAHLAESPLHLNMREVTQGWCSKRASCLGVLSSIV